MVKDLHNLLESLFRSGFSGLWVEVNDIYETQMKILEAVVAFNDKVTEEERKRKLVIWSAASGWSDNQGSKEAPAVQFLRRPVEPNRVYVLYNFHKFLTSPEICARLLENAVKAEELGTTYIVLVPLGTRPPAELSQRFFPIVDSLPTFSQLLGLAKNVAESSKLPISDQDCESAAKAASGLTLYEAANLFSLSLVTEKSYRFEKIMERKAESVASTGFMELYYSGPGFESLGGLDQLKQFCRKCLTNSNPKALPRGVLLLGVPGAGKSAFCRALGVEVKRPVVVANMGALYGSLVGQTEQNVRKMLSFVDSIAPCILFIDEVEKALSGVQSSGKTDSGVSSRVFGAFLTWLNDHTTDVYTIVTSNDISKLPPEFSRAERFDALFFLDIPSEEERARIWEIYLKQYELDLLKIDPCVGFSKGWTGAEIKTCCRLACMLNIPLDRAASLVVPVAETMKENLANLRSWASGRCLSATKRGIYYEDVNTAPHGRALTVDF